LHSLTPLVVFHSVAATSVLGFRDSDAATFAAVHDNGDEFDFLLGTKSLDVLFVVHGWVCVYLMAMLMVCFEVGNGSYSHLSDDVAL
jgi:hypothetical protein